MLSLLISAFFLVTWLAAAPPAAARLAKDIAEEKIGECVSAYIDRHYRGTKLAYFVRCPLCLSHWILGVLALACFQGWAALPFPWFLQLMTAIMFVLAATEITHRVWLSK